jgi:hypothetical protein
MGQMRSLHLFQRVGCSCEVTMYLQTVYETCDQANVDASTGQCSAPSWQPLPSWLPQLTAADGVSIGVAILLAWATAYAYKVLRRVGD